MKNLKSLKQALQSAFFIAFTMIWVACTPNDEAGVVGGGNPEIEVSFDFGLSNTSQLAKTLQAQSEPQYQFKDESGLVFLVDSAWVNLAKIKLSGEDEYVGEGPFLINLLTGTHPELSNLKIPNADYEELSFILQDVESESFMNNYTLWVEGSFSYRGFRYPYELKLKFNEDMKLKPSSPFRFNDSMLNSVSTAFLLDRWFQGISIKDCIDSGNISIFTGSLSLDDAVDGCIDIDRIKLNVKNSLSVK